jgi:hypothetical protein
LRRAFVDIFVSWLPVDFGEFKRLERVEHVLKDPHVYLLDSIALG